MFDTKSIITGVAVFVIGSIAVAQLKNVSALRRLLT